MRLPSFFRHDDHRRLVGAADGVARLLQVAGAAAARILPAG
jgi:hypothetical protein